MIFNNVFSIIIIIIIILKENNTFVEQGNILIRRDFCNVSNNQNPEKYHGFHRNMKQHNCFHSDNNKKCF